MALPDRALQLLDQLQYAGIGQRPILFICHSLGGLLVKQILKMSHHTQGDSLRDARLAQVATNTRAVLFLATPHRFAALATKLDSFRKQFGTSVNIADLRDHDARVHDLHDWYRIHAPIIGVETITYYEGHDAGNVLRIVNELSCHPGVGAPPVPLDENHISIAKPRENTAQVYRAARTLLQEAAFNAAPILLQATPVRAPQLASTPVIVRHAVPTSKISERSIVSQLIQISSPATQSRDVDIVFVHGLGGDPRATWQSSDGGFWPEWLATDLPEAGVWSLGYDAAMTVFGGSMPIVDRAANATAELEARGLGSAPIVFVCHSLGGLLVKQMIRGSVEHRGAASTWLSQATKGVVFLATPHSGAASATWADRLLGILAGPILKEIKADTPLLRDINQWYRSNAGRLGIKHQVYSETRSIKGVMVVDQASSDPGISDLIPIPLDEDHFSICKPSSRDSTMYLRVRTFAVHFIRAPSPSSAAIQMTFGTAQTVSAITVLPEANLRRILIQRFQRVEVAVLWFDTFGDAIDDHLPGKSLNECVIELLMRAKRQGREGLLHEAIALERPDLKPILSQSEST